MVVIPCRRTRHGNVCRTRSACIPGGRRRLGSGSRYRNEDGTQVLQFGEFFTVSLDRLRDANTATLPALFS